ncbi:hypothetical protein HJC23_011922 [Cyclotella cryptica]|uniref:Uncharacterized protein n=1 Tax=Cyclotella cryptica TaxID=29204 RepID=A0ABD3NLN4_9STRA|eukprot:CCRYP_020466-RA/>CCRYP_020466-RA protein AED:0.09 eAED:0.09 QI:0/-1/0/1/-1/1/1/0/436
MLGIRRRDLARDRCKSTIGTNCSIASGDHEVKLKNSVSLTSSSSCDSSDQECHPRISGFMKNVAPTVVTKYINTNKMNSPFDHGNIHGNLYDRSIFHTALAIKTGKMSSTELTALSASNKKNEKTVQVVAASAKSMSSPVITVQRNDSTLITNTLTSTRTATRAIRRHKRSSAKRNKRASSSDAIITDSTTKKGISPLESLTPLQRRVLNAKKYPREHRPNAPELACQSHVDREVTKKVTDNIKTYASNCNNQSLKAIPATKDKSKNVTYTGNTEQVKAKKPDYNTGGQFRKHRSSFEETTGNQADEGENVKRDISINPSTHVSNNRTKPPIKNVLTREPTNYAPFDEDEEFYQEKVEVVVLPGNTNAHETVIIDSSRNLNHTVSFDTEEQAASIRRMELLRRARSLIKSRTDPTPCSDDAAQANLMRIDLKDLHL